MLWRGRQPGLPSNVGAPLPRESAGLFEVHLVLLRPVFNADRMIAAVHHPQVPERRWRSTGIERRQVCQSRRRDRERTAIRNNEPEQAQRLHVSSAVARPEYVGRQAEAVCDASEDSDLLRRQGSGQRELLQGGTPAWMSGRRASVRHRTPAQIFQDQGLRDLVECTSGQDRDAKRRESKLRRP